MTEIYVNGNLLELGDIKTVKVFQINDIGEPRDRQLDYVLPFGIPHTPNNIISLEMLGVIGNTSKTPYRRLKGKLVENRIEIIPDGVITISENSKNTFKAHIYGGNVYLFDKIGSKKINELNFTDVNHGLSKENFVNSFTKDSGYIYAISDFGKFKPETGIEINYQLPSLFVHTLWNKIFFEAGVSYYGDIFQTEQFKKLVITTHRGYNSDIDVINNPIEITASSETETATAIVQFQSGSIMLTTHSEVLMRYPAQPNIFIYNNNDKGSIIQPIDSGIYNFDFHLDVSVEDTPLIFNAYFRVVEINYLGDDTVVHNESLGSVTYSNPIDTNLSGQVYLDGGKDYFLSVYYAYVHDSGTTPSNNITQTITNFSFKNNVSLTTINFKDYIGELSQIAFVKDIMQHFGLICQKRRNELAYDFIQIKTLINDRSNTLDWSNKLVKEIKEKYKLPKYAQSNVFAYNYLEDDSVRFADGSIDIDNENLPSEKTLVQRPYNAPTISDKKIDEQEITYTPFWVIERNDDGSIKEYKPFQSKNYIGEVKYINTSIDYFFANGTVEQFSGEVPVFDFSNLQYKQLLNENYTELKHTLDFHNVKTVFLMLNELDIQNLDMFKTIFLEQYASDFYINKIKYTDSTTPSQVELVKIKRS